jgi:hypothetical protein
MKITARGATDAANIVLFWPDNLPDHADAQLASGDPIPLVECLRDHGKLIWFLCDSDGDYTVSIYVRSGIPDELVAHCKDEEIIPALTVRGVGYFGGMEYMFKEDSTLLKKYPGMCEQIHIPEGIYSARVYRVDTPEELYESWMETHTMPRAKRLWELHSTIAAGAVVSVPVSLLAFFWLPWAISFCLLAVASALVFSAVAMSRTDWYKSVAKVNENFGYTFPAYVVHLE